MAAADAQTAARVERMGMKLIQPSSGLSALGHVLSNMGSMSLTLNSMAQPVTAVVPFIWRRFLERYVEDRHRMQGVSPLREASSSSIPLFFSQVEEVLTYTARVAAPRDITAQCITKGAAALPELAMDATLRMEVQAKVRGTSVRTF
jgi:hypothetical protein